MKIYCPKHSEHSEEFENIFKIARSSLKYFKNLFDMNIPFGKQDFVFVPHLDMVAMENVGCITFDEKFLEPNQSLLERDYFYSLITHELAHTWFGNLVTPEWWDDLWLNESFATFFSFEALTKIAQLEPETMGYFQKHWLFFNRHKSEALVQDQYSNTHKIRDEVKDTSHAIVKFNDITYSKGASILNYLYYNLDDEIRKKMVRNYLKVFKYKTANYKQFKDSLLELTQNRNIDSPLSIIEPFLDNKGLMRLNTNLKSYQGKINEVEVEQQPCDYATQHNVYDFFVDVLLIYEGSQVVQDKILLKFPRGWQNTYEQEDFDTSLRSDSSDEGLNQEENSPKAKKSIYPTTTIPEIKNQKEPRAIVLNAKNLAYFVQSFDEKSVEFLVKESYKIKNPVTRLVIARDLSEMIKSGHLDVDTYVEFAINLLRKEPEDEICYQVLQTCIYNILNYVKYEEQEKLKESLFNLINNELFELKKNLHKSLINFMIDLVHFESDIEQFQINEIVAKFQEKKKESSFVRMSSLNDEESEENYFNSKQDFSQLDENTKFRLLETVIESINFSVKDRNYIKEQITASVNREVNTKEHLAHLHFEKYTLDACNPSLKQKEDCWQLIVNKDNTKLVDRDYEALMKGFARRSQYKLLKNFFRKRFFKDFSQVKFNFGEDYALLYFRTLNPSFVVCEKVLLQFEDLLKALKYDDYKLIDECEKGIKFINLVISEMKMKLTILNKSQKYHSHHK